MDANVHLVSASDMLPPVSEKRKGVVGGVAAADDDGFVGGAAFTERRSHAIFFLNGKSTRRHTGVWLRQDDRKRIVFGNV